MAPERHYLFDWGDTLMVDLPGQTGPMCDWPRVQAVAGAADCLAALSRRAHCHLATNARDSDVVRIRAALGRVHLDSYLEHIFCFREVGHMKPSPEYFAHVVAALDCPPDHIVMVGDGLDADVRGALRCGLQAVWYNPEAAPIPEGIRAVASLHELALSAVEGSHS